MKKVVLLIIVIVVFWMMGVKLVKAVCQGFCTTCDAITLHYECANGEICSGPGDLGCRDKSTCEYKYTYCGGPAVCDCDSVTSTCGCAGGCEPGQIYWSDTCCTPNWPNPLCTTACGTAGHYVEDGCGNSHWCDPTEACCVESDPDTPGLVSPVNGSIFNVGSLINLDWNAISDWGDGCPNTNKYSVCISSNQVACDLTWVDTTTSVTNYNWTPSVGDSYVTWSVQSNNGSNIKNSETRNFCVEGETCSLQCGQAKDCGGNCGVGDTGVPGVPVINYPAGTSSSPVILAPGVTGVALSLGGTTSLADLYYYGVYDDGAGFTFVSSTATSVGITGLLPGNLYSWRARAVNDTCVPIVGGVGITSAASNYGYFRVNSAPVIGNFYIYNIGNTLVGAETGSRNHICQSEFNGSRWVNFRLNVTDADGVNDINQVSLSWNGTTYTLDRGATWATGATYSKTVDYGAYHDQGVYLINATAVDIHNQSTSQSTGRNWKVWNCQVPVEGNLYDGSADHSCLGGFSNLADLDMGFDALEFNNVSGSVTATVMVPNAFGTDNLIWGRNYLPLINGGDSPNPDGDLAATGRLTRLIGPGIPIGDCLPGNMVNTGNIDAYSLTPSAQVDFSFIRDQESWYQVRGGGIRAGDSIQSGVPVTANPLERYLTLGKSLPTTINNGLVSYAVNFSNTNGYNDEAYGSPNSWWKNSSLLPATRYGYQYFYNNLYVKAGVGVTGKTWDEKPSEGVFFVNGNLTIDSNFVLPADRFFMVVVSGSITITNGVTQIDGIYVSDGEISVTGNSNNALEINGMFYSRSSVRLARSFTDKTLNNTSPATIVNYRPSLLFNMPIKISKVISGWRDD